MSFSYSTFESEMQVRPDDIDMNRHVHNSRYFDYILAARYDQMERCYGMPMEKFMQLGFGWVVRTAFIEYKRPLTLGERFLVQTGIEEIESDGVKVRFQILKKENRKLCCNGYFHYIMIDAQTGHAKEIPGWIKEKYSI
jgi:acyl-CoA thioester hydrolase